MMRRAIRLLWQALREIFDEAAYERYLRRTGEEESRESFAAFTAMSSGAKERRARCC
jgi:hypothetical protein